MRQIVVGASRIMLLVRGSLYRSITALICFLQKAHAICDIPQTWWRYACGLTTLAGTKASIKKSFGRSMLYIMEESLTSEVIFFALFIYITDSTTIHRSTFFSWRHTLEGWGLTWLVPTRLSLWSMTGTQWRTCRYFTPPNKLKHNQVFKPTSVHSISFLFKAMDRAHRIGQKKVVNVYRLITRGTLEEKIMGYVCWLGIC